MTGAETGVRRRICIVGPLPLTINVFLRKHVGALSKVYDVTLVANGRAEDLPGVLGPHVSFVPVAIERRVRVERDVLALLRLWRLFRKERFDSVHSIIPKTGLLSMVAARLAGVPVRIHTFTGQTWATRRGLGRLALKSLDRLLAMSASRLLADSHSQRLFLVENGIVRASAIDVLANGSVAGVDSSRFKPDAEARREIRERLGIPREAVAFVFVGRLTRDKGLVDLSRAFLAAARRNGSIHLLIVGPDEEGLAEVFSALAEQVPGRVHSVGFADRPETYLAAADVFCLPSYREGFGMALIEAAAVGLPSIASRIYGITDAVDDGVTGILHRPGDVPEIAEALCLLASDPQLRLRMGGAARERAMSKFSEARVTGALMAFYREVWSRPEGRSVAPAAGE
jgi:glycosyltransferase involved in cell wall biosynthesis